MKMIKKVGIVAYGAYIPRIRIKVADIGAPSSLGILEKAVAGADEDTLTMAVQASQDAIESMSNGVDAIQAVYVGSETHPYAVKPTSGMLAGYLGINENCYAADLQFACKSGTASLQVVSALVASGMIKYGLAVGSDHGKAADNDVLKFTAASGAAAFVVSENEHEIIAYLDDAFSITTDIQDFWRAQGDDHPSHSGRFTAEPGYLTHIEKATLGLLKKTGLKISDFAHIVFHMPNLALPLKVAKRLGVTESQMNKGLIVSKIGNPFSASSLLGLARVLDHALPLERILLVSYGSGAGADAMAFTVTENIQNYKPLTSVDELIANKINSTQ